MTTELGNTPCDCPQHRHGAPRVLGGHTFALEAAGLISDPDGQVMFRWDCSCGRAGRWQHRRSEAYHLWRAHVRRTQDRLNLAQIEEMYS